MIRLLCTELSPERVTVVQLKSERGLQADALARQFEDAGCSHVTAFDSTKDALKHVLSEKKEGDHSLYGRLPLPDRRDIGGFEVTVTPDVNSDGPKGRRRIMLDFEEEIARFQPSLEVGDVETQIVKEDLTDMTDLMMELLKTGSNRKRL